MGHFFLAIDPRQFREKGVAADLEGMMDRLRALQPSTRTTGARCRDPEGAANDDVASGIPLSRRRHEDSSTVCRASACAFLPRAKE